MVIKKLELQAPGSLGITLAPNGSMFGPAGKFFAGAGELHEPSHPEVSPPEGRPMGKVGFPPSTFMVASEGFRSRALDEPPSAYMVGPSQECQWEPSGQQAPSVAWVQTS